MEDFLVQKVASDFARRVAVECSVNSIFQDRRARNLSVINQRAEAGAIRAEIASQYPDHDVPAIKTIEGHLRKTSE